MKTLVVIPTYNEVDNIAPLVHRLRVAAPELEILIVDDSSPDGTAALVRTLRSQLGGLHLIERPGKADLASAYVLGFQHALGLGAERVIQMDADLSHDPADVPRLCRSEADLVVGSRYVDGGGTEGWQRSRELLSRFGSLYARLWLGLSLRDCTSGFKVWKADLLESVLRQPLEASGYAFQVEMSLRAVRRGAVIEELPIVFTERVAGVSKMSLPIAAEAAFRVPQLRSQR